MRVAFISSMCLVAVLGAGCRKADPMGKADSVEVSKVRAALAERERKIVSYRYEGVTVQGTERAEFAFAYRAPNKMRGDLKSARMTFAFDGKWFVQFDENTQIMTKIDVSASPRERGALFLHKAFSPFAPEGWRTPLLGGTLTAEPKQVDGRSLLAVSARAADGADAVAMEFLFAPPTMDFVGKSVVGGGATRVLEQHCDAKLGLCFPTKVEEGFPGGPVAVTTLTGIEINGPLPAEYFEPQPPEGAQVQKRGLE